MEEEKKTGIIEKAMLLLKARLTPEQEAKTADIKRRIAEIKTELRNNNQRGLEKLQEEIKSGLLSYSSLQSSGNFDSLKRAVNNTLLKGYGIKMAGTAKQGTRLVRGGQTYDPTVTPYKSFLINDPKKKGSTVRSGQIVSKDEDEKKEIPIPEPSDLGPNPDPDVIESSGRIGEFFDALDIKQEKTEKTEDDFKRLIALEEKKSEAMKEKQKLQASEKKAKLAEKKAKLAEKKANAFKERKSKLFAKISDIEKPMSTKERQALAESRVDPVKTKAIREKVAQKVSDQKIRARIEKLIKQSKQSKEQKESKYDPEIIARDFKPEKSEIEQDIEMDDPDFDLDPIDAQQKQFKDLGYYAPSGYRRVMRERKEFYKGVRSADKNTDYYDSRKNKDSDRDFNKDPRFLDFEEDYKHNERDKQIARQYKMLNPGDYVSDEETFGQESIDEGKLIDRVEVYERQIIDELDRLEQKKAIAVRSGEVDGNKPYTIGEYDEMFSRTDEQKQQSRERHLEVIGDFMRDNRISSNVLEGGSINNLSNRALSHIATELGIGEQTVNRYQGAVDIYNIAKKEGLVDKVLGSDRVKDTYIGRALNQLDTEVSKGGRFDNMGKKFANILEAMTVPIKIMAGEADPRDIGKIYRGFTSVKDIGKGVYNVARGKPETKTETTETETTEQKIIRELDEIRRNTTPGAPSEPLPDKAGLTYPKSQQAAVYRFPRSDQNWTGVGLVQASVTNYLNDEGLYGGSYTSSEI